MITTTTVSPVRFGNRTPTARGLRRNIVNMAGETVSETIVLWTAPVCLDVDTLSKWRKQLQHGESQ